MGQKKQGRGRQSQTLKSPKRKSLGNTLEREKLASNLSGTNSTILARLILFPDNALNLDQSKSCNLIKFA